MDDDEQPIPTGGVRLRWRQLPAHVRTAIEDRLGSPVVQAVSQPGGFSPGVAARLRLADGSRAFVKAASAAQNEQTPGMYRREAVVAAALPDHLPVSRLRFVHDDGSWVALVFDDVDGRTPTLPWQRHELELALASLAVLAERLTPAPVAAPPVEVALADDFGAWRRLIGAGEQALPTTGLDLSLSGWARRHLDALAELESRWAEGARGDTLLHTDLRADNLLVTAGDEVVVIDWAGPAVGAPWIDTVLFCINPALFGGWDPERLLAAHPVAGVADPAAVDAVLCAALGYFVWSSRQPAPIGLPTVRRFQRAQERVVWSWLARRTGWT